jgi:Zn-dependent protease with chaperone function
MTTLEGRYFDGIKPLAVPASLKFDARQVQLTSEGDCEPVTGDFTAEQLKISARIGASERFITLPNGGQFLCADTAFLDDLPQDSPSEGPVAWLEQRWLVALGCVALICAMLLAGYFFGLPAAAEVIAKRIPMQTEATLGDQALSWMDDQGWLKPTALDSGKQKAILNDFAALYQGLPFEKHYRIYFRSSGFIGANAFAFPGGAIVITDKMIETAVTDDEVMSVLAHEIAHVELRHTLRSILQGSAVGLIAATVTADAATLSGAVAGLPVMLAQTRYSRSFEAEADDYAFRLLKEKGYSPDAFADLMERLSMAEPAMRGAMTWIATHPATSERVKKARAAARRQPIP